MYGIKIPQDTRDPASIEMVALYGLSNPMPMLVMEKSK
jgi:hypothetical protein